MFFFSRVSGEETTSITLFHFLKLSPNLTLSAIRHTKGNGMLQFVLFYGRRGITVLGSSVDIGRE